MEALKNNIDMIITNMAMINNEIQLIHQKYVPSPAPDEPPQLQYQVAAGGSS
jgi:hypothetical protein